jgi:hypothetical protein
VLGGAEETTTGVIRRRAMDVGVDDRASDPEGRPSSRIHGA